MQLPIRQKIWNFMNCFHDFIYFFIFVFFCQCDVSAMNLRAMQC